MERPNIIYGDKHRIYTSSNQTISKENIQNNNNNKYTLFEWGIHSRGRSLLSHYHCDCGVIVFNGLFNTAQWTLYKTKALSRG